MFKKVKYFLFNIKKIYSLIFLYPKKTLRDFDVGYDYYWKEKRGDGIGALSDWQKNRADIILKNIKHCGALTIIDIGCGDGSILYYLKKKNEIIKTLIGVDNSELALNKARDFGLKTYKINLTDFEKIDGLPDADYFLILEVLEHLQNSEKMLNLVYKKAYRGVFFSLPNSGFILHRIRFFFGRVPLQWKTHPSEHLRFWTYKDLKWWLNALGYENYQIFFYKGVPVLNKIWPSMLAAGFVVLCKK